ncbi:hypothetical protein EMPS_02739 [Entomortierella parvispora]|uniref:Uncharacterized protein n=1 Tax=Entomortierella parvispora TaxID=205924 RepID=A0A9P3LU79_9FUNG|nr:hypothetical protein EMPS_02739 [Entomortierella parvispora]
MSSILNAIRSAPTSTTRGFTSLNIASATVAPKSAFHPEHHPIMLQQLVQSLANKPAATSSVASASKTAMSSGNHAYSSSSVTSVPESAGQIFAKQYLKA